MANGATCLLYLLVLSSFYFFVTSAYRYERYYDDRQSDDDVETVRTRERCPRSYKLNYATGDCELRHKPSSGGEFKSSRENIKERYYKDEDTEYNQGVSGRTDSKEFTATQQRDFILSSKETDKNAQSEEDDDENKRRKKHNLISRSADSNIVIRLPQSSSSYPPPLMPPYMPPQLLGLPSVPAPMPALMGLPSVPAPMQALMGLPMPPIPIMPPLFMPPPEPVQEPPIFIFVPPPPPPPCRKKCTSTTESSAELAAKTSKTTTTIPLFSTTQCTPMTLTICAPPKETTPCPTAQQITTPCPPATAPTTVCPPAVSTTTPKTGSSTTDPGQPKRRAVETTSRTCLDDNEKTLREKKRLTRRQRRRKHTKKLTNTTKSLKITHSHTKKRSKGVINTHTHKPTMKMTNKHLAVTTSLLKSNEREEEDQNASIVDSLSCPPNSYNCKTWKNGKKGTRKIIIEEIWGDKDGKDKFNNEANETINESKNEEEKITSSQNSVSEEKDEAKTLTYSDEVETPEVETQETTTTKFSTVRHHHKDHGITKLKETFRPLNTNFKTQLINLLNQSQHSDMLAFMRLINKVDLPIDDKRTTKHTTVTETTPLATKSMRDLDAAMFAVRKVLNEIGIDIDAKKREKLRSMETTVHHSTSHSTTTTNDKLVTMGTSRHYHKKKSGFVPRPANEFLQFWKTDKHNSENSMNNTIYNTTKRINSSHTTHDFDNVSKENENIQQYPYYSTNLTNFYEGLLKEGENSKKVDKTEINYKEFLKILNLIHPKGENAMAKYTSE